MERHKTIHATNDRPGFRFNEPALHIVEAGSWYYDTPGTREMINTGFPQRAPLSSFMPEGMRFEDDPAAEFEGADSAGAVFFYPDQRPRFHA